MAEENKTTEEQPTTTPEPGKKEKLAIQEEYQKATPKARKKNFTVDPITKTLRRA